MQLISLHNITSVLRTGLHHIIQCYISSNCTLANISFRYMIMRFLDFCAKKSSNGCIAHYGSLEIDISELLFFYLVISAVLLLSWCSVILIRFIEYAPGFLLIESANHIMIWCTTYVWGPKKLAYHSYLNEYFPCHFNIWPTSPFHNAPDSQLDLLSHFYHTHFISIKTE